MLVEIIILNSWWSIFETIKQLYLSCTRHKSKHRKQRCISLNISEIVCFNLKFLHHWLRCTPCILQIYGIYSEASIEILESSNLRSFSWIIRFILPIPVESTVFNNDLKWSFNLNEWILKQIGIKSIIVLYICTWLFIVCIWENIVTIPDNIRRFPRSISILFKSFMLKISSRRSNYCNQSSIVSGEVLSVCIVSKGVFVHVHIVSMSWKSITNNVSSKSRGINRIVGCGHCWI